MSKQQEKDATVAEEIKAVARTTRSIIIATGAALVVASFLISVFMPPVAPSVQKVKSVRSSLSSEIEELKDEIISKSTTAEKKDLESLKIKLLSLNNRKEIIDTEYKQAKKDAEISGFPSWHKFMWHFGLGLILLGQTIYIIARSNSLEGDEKKADEDVGMILLTVSGFYMAWIFFPYDDLPKPLYFTILFAIGIISMALGYHINKFDFLTRKQLKHKVVFVMRQLVLVIPDYVKDPDKYEKEIVEPTLDKLNE